MSVKPNENAFLDDHNLNLIFFGADFTVDSPWCYYINNIKNASRVDSHLNAKQGPFYLGLSSNILYSKVLGKFIETTYFNPFINHRVFPISGSAPFPARRCARREAREREFVSRFAKNPTPSYSFPPSPPHPLIAPFLFLWLFFSYLFIYHYYL